MKRSSLSLAAVLLLPLLVFADDQPPQGAPTQPPAGSSTAKTPRELFLVGEALPAEVPDLAPEALKDIQSLQGRSLPDAEVRPALDRVAKAWKLSSDEQGRAWLIYGPASDPELKALREAIAKRGAGGTVSAEDEKKLQAKLDGLAARFKTKASDESMPGGAGGEVRGGTGRGMSLKDIQALNLTPPAQTSLNPAQSVAPPAALGDIATTQRGWGEWIASFVTKNQSVMVLNSLLVKPTQEEQQKLNEAVELLARVDPQSKSVRDALYGDDGSGGPRVRINYAETPGLHGFMVPLPGHMRNHHGEQASVTINRNLKGASTESTALVVGHEVGTHAEDQNSGFLNQKGSHILSEVRALVDDARRYLNTRADAGEERHQEIRHETPWQQGDLKARMVLGLDISWYDYKDKAGKDTQVNKDGYAIFDYRKKNPKATPAQVVREYIRMKYKDSGEEGMENISLYDNSPLGQYNKETDRLIAERQRVYKENSGWNGAYRFMESSY